MRSPRPTKSSKKVATDMPSTRRSREPNTSPNPMEVLENTLAKLSAVMKTHRAEIEAEQEQAVAQAGVTGRKVKDGRRRNHRAMRATPQRTTRSEATSSLTLAESSSASEGSPSQKSFAFSFEHPISKAQLTDAGYAHPPTISATDTKPPLVSDHRQSVEDGSPKASSATVADSRTDVRRELDDFRSSLRTELLDELRADRLTELQADLATTQNSMRDALSAQISAELHAELQATREALRVQLGAELTAVFEPRLRDLRQDTEKRLAELSSEITAIKEIVNFSLTPVWQHIRGEREEVGRRLGELEVSVQKELEDVRDSLVPVWERLREEREEISQKLGDLEETLRGELLEVEETSAFNLARKNTEMRGAVVQLLQTSEAKTKGERKAEQKTKLETIREDLHAALTEQLRGLKAENKGALDTYKAEALGELCSTQDQHKAELEKRLEDQMFALEGKLAVVLQKPLYPPKSSTRDTLALLPLDNSRDSHTHFVLALLILNRGKEGTVFPPHVFHQHGFDSLQRAWDWVIPDHHVQAAQDKGIDFGRYMEGIRVLAAEYMNRHSEVKSRVLMISWWLYDHLKMDNRYDDLVEWFKGVAADKDFTMCPKRL